MRTLQVRSRVTTSGKQRRSVESRPRASQQRARGAGPAHPKGPARMNRDARRGWGDSTSPEGLSCRFTRKSRTREPCCPRTPNLDVYCYCRSAPDVKSDALAVLKAFHACGEDALQSPRSRQSLFALHSCRGSRLRSSWQGLLLELRIEVASLFRDVAVFWFCAFAWLVCLVYASVLSGRDSLRRAATLSGILANGLLTRARGAGPAHP